VSDQESSKSIIEYIVYAVALVLLAPYAGCHILTSPASEEAILMARPESASNLPLEADTVSVSEQHSPINEQRHHAGAAREELAEIRELLAR
jgi:hypothetical protein